MTSDGRRGSVKQADNGTWFYVMDVPSNELDARGRPKRKQARKRGFKTRRDAQRALTEALGTLTTQTFVAHSRQTLGQFMVTTWLPAIRKTVKQSTYESYERVARLHTLERPIGARKLQDVSGPDLNRHYGVLMDGDDDHEALSAKTTRYCANVLHRAFRDAMKWNLIPINPVEQSDRPKATARPEMKTWRVDELNRFLEAANEHRMMGAFWLLATTGLRRGEALALRWEDVNLETGRVKIWRALLDQNTAPSWRFESTKTTKGNRTIALGADCVAALRIHRARQNAERLALGEGWTDNDLISPSGDGQPISPRRLTEQFGRLCARHDLRHIRVHDLRHTFATLSLEGGVHPRVVQEALGHSNVSVTLDIYSHVDFTLQTQAADMLAQMRAKGRES